MLRSTLLAFAAGCVLWGCGQVTEVTKALEGPGGSSGGSDTPTFQVSDVPLAGGAADAGPVADTGGSAPDVGSADAGPGAGSGGGAEADTYTGPQTQFVDNDGDTIFDQDDNCPLDPNKDQADMDGDGLGDVCDPDADGDKISNAADCEPMDPDVFPGSQEKCDGKDNNCDGETDGEGSIGCRMYYMDGDGDGSGVSETGVCLCAPSDPKQVELGGDCDDDDPTVHPWAPERCNDADDNCNLLIDDGCDDDGDGYCDATMVVEGTPAVCPLGGGDCLDWSPDVNPSVAEIPDNGLDDNCDGIKEGEPITVLEPDCTGMPCTGQSNDALLCGLDICYPQLPDMVQSVQVWSPTLSNTAQAWAVVNHFGSPTNDLAPFGPPSYVLLSTGPALGTSHSTELGGVTTVDPYAPGEFYSTYDNMEIKLKLKAPPGAKGFTIDYLYMSEEYEEFIGSEYNDKFYMILKAPQTTNNQPVVVNFTACLEPNVYYDFIQDGQKWCYIAINTAFSEPCSNPTTDISGTGFECGSGGFTNGSSTGWLQTSWPIAPDEVFELTFHIHDTSDGIYDSQVILDNFRWETDAFVQGTASHN